MAINDKPRFASVLATMAVVYDKQVSPILADVYLKILDGLTIEQVESAAEAWMDTGKWFPKPAELLEMIEGSADDKAEAAWLHADREVQRVGYRGSPSIACPATISAIESCGGWERFCSVPEREVPFIRKDFLRAFAAYSKAPPRNIQPLIGEVDRIRDRRSGRELVGIGEVVKRIAKE